MKGLWLILLALGLVGCYRPESPDQIDEGVRLVFAGNDGRYVRFQGYLAEELGKALVTRLGWRVSPAGTATLTIVLKEEDISVWDRNLDSIPLGQRVRMRGNVLLSTRSGAITTTFTGETVVTTIGYEPQVLRACAVSCSSSIVEWLGVNASTIQHPLPSPAPAPARQGWLRR